MTWFATTTPVYPSARGAMLLELLVALAIFVVAGLTVTAAVERGTSAAELSRDHLIAVDLARSAMTQIEAGIARPETLSGPVPAWDEPEANAGGDDGLRSTTSFADIAPRPTGWKLEIKTEPAKYSGLTLVTVTASKRRGATSDAVSASFSLAQFVRLSAPELDSIGDSDSLSTRAKAGLNRGGDAAPDSSSNPPARPPGSGSRVPPAPRSKPEGK